MFEECVNVPFTSWLSASLFKIVRSFQKVRNVLNRPMRVEKIHTDAQGGTKLCSPLLRNVLDHANFLFLISGFPSEVLNQVVGAVYLLRRPRSSAAYNCAIITSLGRFDSCKHMPGHQTIDSGLDAARCTLRAAISGSICHLHLFKKDCKILPSALCPDNRQ